MTGSPGRLARANGGSSSGSSPLTSTHITDLQAFLRSRRSIRRFKPEPVPDSVIQDILTTATFAPSAHNRQPWRFCVLTGLSSRTRLADSMAADFERDLMKDGVPPEKIQAQIKRSKERITSAPVAILLCLDTDEMDSYPDVKRNQAEHMMAVQSVAAGGMQLLLAAHAEGVGAVWACWPLFAQETILRILKLPESWEPQGLFFLGYPTDIPEVKMRKPLHKIMIKR